jgi:hypothetical protein
MTDYMVLFLILGLFLLGGMIALKSGGVGFRGIAGNFSAMLLRIVGYLAALFAVQHAIGFPSYLSW